MVFLSKMREITLKTVDFLFSHLLPDGGSQPQKSRRLFLIFCRAESSTKNASSFSLKKIFFFILEIFFYCVCTVIWPH